MTTILQETSADSKDTLIWEPFEFPDLFDENGEDDDTEDEQEGSEYGNDLEYGIFLSDQQYDSEDEKDPSFWHRDIRWQWAIKKS